MAVVTTRTRSAASYTVACICPMGVELAPVKAMLDKVHPSLPVQREQNSYILGDMAGHNVVVAVLPEIGTNAAATVAVQLLNDFPSIHFGLLVGIGGGVPDNEDNGNDIRLGDVVVSKPTSTFGGVVQYDLGKYTSDNGFERTGSLNKPPTVLRTWVEQLAADHLISGSQMPLFLVKMLERYPAMQARYSHPGSESDMLFSADYPHDGGRDCTSCDRERLVKREKRFSHDPRLHYGIIASANVVVKDSAVRERLRRDVKGLMCLEMEAAGLVNDFPCLVIRGICDYADSHKNKKWQPYAAATAAAYMKELLSIIPPKEITKSESTGQFDHNQRHRLGLNLFDAPDMNADLFVGRDLETEQIHSTLRPDHNTVGRKIVVLGGMGGVGKTQLYITYLKRFHEHYSSVFWLNASSEISLQQSFRLLADRIFPANSIDTKEMSHDQVKTTVLNWLSELENTAWLLVFDNYDEPEKFKIKNYYPYVYHGSIVITSRLPGQIDGVPIQVQALSNDKDSLEILEKRSGRTNVIDDIHAKQLVARLKGLPLALVTAGAYLRRSTCTFEQYLQIYESRWNVDTRGPPPLHEYQGRTLYNTWNISYERLETEDPIAAGFLKLLGYFDSQNISYELLCRRDENQSQSYVTGLWKDLFGALSITSNSPSPRQLLTATIDRTRFESIMASLVDHCFVEVQNATQTYSVHACVHDWVLASLNNHIDSDSYWYAFDRVADLVSEMKVDSLGHLQYANMAPHAAWLTRDAFDIVGNNIGRSRLNKARRIALFLTEQMQFNPAERLYTRTLARQEKLFGKKHLSTLKTVNLLGILCDKQGRVEEAEQLYTRALVERQKVLGMNHRSTLDTVHNLGKIYYNQKKYDEAEQMYVRALAGTEKTTGAENPSTLTTMFNLGLLYFAQKKFEEAEHMFARALAGFEKALGMDHMSTLETMGELSRLYRVRGKLDAAEENYKQTLKGKTKVLGAHHVSSLTTMVNLANLYADTDRYMEAENLYVQALAGFERSLGANHSLALGVTENLAVLYRRQNRLDDAERMYMRVQAGYKESIGEEHETTLKMIYRLGDVQHEQNKLDLAELHYTQALAGQKKVLGAEHEATLRTVERLNELYGNREQSRGDRSDAEYLLGKEQPNKSALVVETQ